MSGRSYGIIRESKERERREKLSCAMLDFADFIEAAPQGSYHDVKYLPHLKQEILGGFLNAIANTKTLNEVDLYMAGAILLSDYIKDVGDEPFTPYQADFAKIEGDLPVKNKDFVKSNDGDKINCLTHASSDDLLFIISCTKSARLMNPHLQSPFKKFWQKFRESGPYSPFRTDFVDASFKILRV